MAFGLFYSLVVGTKMAIDSIKDWNFDLDSRQKALKNGNLVYTDSKGRTKDVKTDRRLYLVMSDDLMNYVYKDYKTHKVVHILGKTRKGSLREARIKEIIETNQETKKSLEDAIKNKKYYYNDYKNNKISGEIRRVEDGVLLYKIYNNSSNYYIYYVDDIIYNFSVFFDNKNERNEIKIINNIIEHNKHTIEKCKRLGKTEEEINKAIKKYKPILSKEQYYILQKKYVF